MSLAAVLHPPLPHGLPRWARHVPAFVAVGLTWTLAYLLLYAGLRHVMDPQLANLVALVLTTIGDTDANRRLTFGVRDGSTRVLHQAIGLAVLGAGIALTAGSLWFLAQVAPGATTGVELGVLLVANGLAGVLRFAVFAAVMRPTSGP